MNLLKNKLFLGVVCITAGLFVGFVAIPAMSKTGETVQALRMMRTVQAGEQLAAADVEKLIIPANLAKGTIIDANSLSGKYAVYDLCAGDIITAQRVTDERTTENSMTAAAMQGKTVVSITVKNLAASVSGRLLPGDVVSVIATEKTTDGNGVYAGSKTGIPDELKYVEVCMVSASDGTDAKVSSALSDGAENKLPTTVSLYTSEAQAIKLAELEQNAEIQLVFVARGSAADKYIKNRVLEELR